MDSDSGGTVPWGNVRRMTRGRALDRRAVDIASLQAGVISTRQARSAGLSPEAIARRVRSGEWERRGNALIIRSVSSGGDACEGWILQANAPEGSVVSGPIAARLGGWDLPGTERIVVASERCRMTLEGVTVIQRSALPPAYMAAGLHLAVPIEAVADTIGIAGMHRAHEVVDRALQQRWFGIEDLDEVIAGRAGRGNRGVGALRRARMRMATGSRSEAEQRMGRLLRRSRTGDWIANHPVLDRSGRVVAEIDFAHLDLRIAIEVDGRAFHSDRRSFERDRARQNDLVLRGWLVLRFTWEQITTKPEWVIAEIREAIAHRSRSFGRSAG